MLTMHHLENSQSMKIVWLLEELGMDYEFKKYPRDPATMLAPAEYKALSPLGTAPVITDGDVVLAESNAIIDYVLDKYGQGRLRPDPGSADHARYLFWFHASQGSLQPLLTTKFVLNVVLSRAPFFAKPLIKPALVALDKSFMEPRLQALLKVMDKDLATSDWLAGDDVTAADIAMSYCTASLATRGGPQGGLDGYPNVQVYARRVLERGAYQRALAKEDAQTTLEVPNLLD